MNKYAVARLEKLNNYIKLDNFRIKYLNKYIDEVNNKINEIFEQYKNIKGLNKYNKETTYKRINLEEELMKLTYEKNKMVSDKQELERLIGSCEDEIKYINDHNGDCLIKGETVPIE